MLVWGNFWFAMINLGAKRLSTTDSYTTNQLEQTDSQQIWIFCIMILASASSAISIEKYITKTLTSKIQSLAK